MPTTFRRALVNGLLVGFLTIPAWFWTYFVLGIFTGVFGMCQTASSDWADFYVTGFFWVPPLLGAITGTVVYQKIVRGDEESLP